MKRDKRYLEWRSAVLERDDNCVVCVKNKTVKHKKFLNAHHLIPKNFTKYALDEDNAITLCPKHHTLGKFSAHKNPIWFVGWLLDNFPELYWLSIQRLEGIRLQDAI